MVKVFQYMWVKKFLQNTVFSVLSFVNRFCPHDKRIILLHLNTPFRDNNKSLFEYLVEKGYNRTYRIVCSCSDTQNYSDLRMENVRFTNAIGGIKAFFTAGNVFYSIGKVFMKPGKNQTVMQMWHGVPLKKVDIGRVDYYTWLLSPSKHFARVFNRMCGMPEERIFIGGYPRCDALFKGNPNYDFGKYDKIILWAPTFRKATNAGFSEFKQCKTVVPVLEPDEYAEFNAFLASVNVKVVVKLHPLQYIYERQMSQMSHFILLTHEDFLARGMDLYRFLVQCDALITDYSSVYFDYLLLDRPIAFTEDDVEEYGSERGFAVDDPDLYKPGFRVNTKEDLMRFCSDLAKGNDDFKEVRARVNKLANDCRDGEFSRRILEHMGINKTIRK